MQTEPDNWQIETAQSAHYESLALWLDSVDIGWTPEALFEKCDAPGYYFSVIARSYSLGESCLDVAGLLLAQTVVDETTLLAIAVRNNFRRARLGQRLIESLQEYAVGRGSKAILLEVRESNSGAINFYRSLGFVQTGARKNYYPPLDQKDENIATNAPVKQRENALLFRFEI